MSYTTKEDIDEWFDRGVAQEATHLIVVVDSFDYEDYPVFIKPTDDLPDKMNDIRNSPMQRIMEVYKLSMDKETQLNETRAFNL